MKTARVTMLAEVTHVVATVIVIISLAGDVDTDLVRCTRDRDCPDESYCRKDECPRCVCVEGYLTDLYRDGQLMKICKTERGRIGGLCDNQNHLHHSCPRGSYCTNNGTCQCEPGLSPHRGGRYCRLPRYGEACSHSTPCESNHGLHCEPISGTCVCHVAYRLPTPWAKFVLDRWSHSKHGNPPRCVIRAVGEPCMEDVECQAVRGSSAYCGECGVCQCRVRGHVPDILGTTCGPGLQYGDDCSLNGGPVCDGTRGLQCGNMCDMLNYRPTARRCACSQMHERVGTKCLPNEVVSTCGSDMDCFLVRRGFGYCHRGHCRRNAKAAPPGYEPYTVTPSCVDENIGSGFYDYEIDESWDSTWSGDHSPDGAIGRHGNSSEREEYETHDLEPVTDSGNGKANGAHSNHGDHNTREDVHRGGHKGHHHSNGGRQEGGTGDGDITFAGSDTSRNVSEEPVYIEPAEDGKDLDISVGTDNDWSEHKQTSSSSAGNYGVSYAGLLSAAGGAISARIMLHGVR